MNYNSCNKKVYLLLFKLIAYTKKRSYCLFVWVFFTSYIRKEKQKKFEINVVYIKIILYRK